MDTQTISSSQGDGRRLHGRALGAVLTALLLALLLEALDQTVVSTALPKINGDSWGWSRHILLPADGGGPECVATHTPGYWHRRDAVP